MDEEKIIIKPIRDLEEADKEKLVELAKGVAEKRQDVEVAKKERDSAGSLLKETAEGKHFELCAEHLMKEQEVLIVAEDQLKSAVLEVYEETKEKKPINGVEVKIVKTMTYISAIVLAWCRKNAPTFLIVNKKPFEKTAVAMGAPVDVKDEPKCYVAKDLSSYLADPDFELASPLEGGK